LPFAMREMSAAAAKQRIGTAAPGLIADGEAVALTAARRYSRQRGHYAAGS
jgi:DeoR/GlpR family transcriptional regulator of sugar metabolism